MIEKKERKEGEPSPLTPSLFRVFALRLFCRSGSPWPPLIHSISPPDEQERRTEERTKKLGRQVPKERKAKLHVGEGFLSSLFVIHAFPPKKVPTPAESMRQTDSQRASRLICHLGGGQLLAAEVASKYGAASSPIVTPAALSIATNYPLDDRKNDTPTPFFVVCPLNAEIWIQGHSRPGHPSGQLRSFTWVRLVDRQTKGQTGHSLDGGVLSRGQILLSFCGWRVGSQLELICHADRHPDGEGSNKVNVQSVTTDLRCRARVNQIRFRKRDVVNLSR